MAVFFNPSVLFVLFFLYHFKFFFNASGKVLLLKIYNIPFVFAEIIIFSVYNWARKIKLTFSLFFIE